MNQRDNTNHEHVLWKAIWGANQIPKVKNYIWRMASNAVAVKANLRRRGMMVDPGCLVCGEDETTEHMVFGYSWTKPVWEEMTGTKSNDTQPQDITSWLDDRRRGEDGSDHQ